MSEKPKRRFWQIHLSTACIAVLLSSLMLLPNVMWRQGRAFARMNPMEGYQPLVCEVRGFPLVDDVRTRDGEPPLIFHTIHGWYFFARVYNPILCGLFLFGVVGVNEYLIRRREGRKT